MGANGTYEKSWGVGGNVKMCVAVYDEGLSLADLRGQNFFKGGIRCEVGTMYVLLWCV